MIFFNSRTPSFGLKIVKNDDLKKIVNFQIKSGISSKKISDTFQKIEELYDDDLSLEFKDIEEKHDPWLGPYLVSKYKFSGEIQASDSKIKYPVDYTSVHKYHTTNPLLLFNEVKRHLNTVKEDIEIKDRQNTTFSEIGRNKKISRKVLKYFASNRLRINSATIQPQKDGKFYITGYLCMGGDSAFYMKSSQPVNCTLLYTKEPTIEKTMRKNISIHGSTPEEAALEFAKGYSGKKLYNYKGEYLTTVPEFIKAPSNNN